MSISSEIQVILAFVFIAIAIPSVIAFTGLKLANKYGTDVRVVWYLFSLAVVTTCITAAWASSIGAIDDKGVFQGELGAAVNVLLKFMLDLDADLKIFSSILAIVLLPQIASYVLSGIFGCASAPIFVGGTIRFFIWGLVKSFVVAAGIVLSVALYGYFSNWSGWSVKGAASMSSMSGLLLMLSFSMLYLYRDFHAAVEKQSPNKFPKIQKMVDSLQSWLTRKLP
ncbi:hypothetical protein [Simplicispira psychrophila]|uniref:hypothetical protein n=1 Tax=Simplicispira psychrophila TaxID=80882 RepID=UPI00048060D7|nr:hypothetical protein [Simplicispira psychrophila]